MQMDNYCHTTTQQKYARAANELDNFINLHLNKNVNNDIYEEYKRLCQQRTHWLLMLLEMKLDLYKQYNIYK
jgi:hypothetical protein